MARQTKPTDEANAAGTTTDVVAAATDAIDINPHSDLPTVPDISTEISEADRPLPFGVYRGTPKPTPKTDA